jgi:RNA polymerase sigma factor (sigma-70 family)
VVVQNSDLFTYFRRGPIRVAGLAGLETVSLSVPVLKRATLLQLPTLILRLLSTRARTVLRPTRSRGLRSIVRDPYAAEDITQNVFAKLIKAIHEYERREVPFAAWIILVARNVGPRPHARGTADPVEEVRTSDDGGEQGGFERAHCLRDALQQLPEDQREVLVLRHIAGLSPGEIADRLGKSEASVHGLHHRGRGALRAALRELEAAPVTATA